MRATRFALGLGAGLATALLYRQLFERKEKDTTTGLVTDENIKASLYKYGKPDSSVSIHEYKSHSLAYDRSKRVPIWVMEVLSNSKEKVANRRQSTFQPDPVVPQEFTAMNSDYLRSGWSRGHMAAAGNYKHCQKSMNDTFYLTNVVPQNFNNNESYWYRIEDYCRKLGQRYDEVRVISGPLFQPRSDENGKKQVQYQVIGENNVNVPTHLYKIIVAENKGDPPLLGSFVVPNEGIVDEPLTTFRVSIEDIERQSGTKFLQFLQKHKSLDLCDTDGCQLMTLKEYSVVYYSRRIPNAKTKDYLESLWTEMKNKGVEPDEFLKQAYERRQNELLEK